MTSDKQHQNNQNERLLNNSRLLTDNEIARKCHKGILVTENYSQKQLAGCCYEFRVGSISYSYDYENKTTKQLRGDVHTIYPFETLTIITLEKVALDSIHFLSLFSKGSLFSMGLTPICTAADPGFKGHLGITMTNLSIRPIQFQKGQGFIKGTFHQLSQKASRPYVGQHGDATMSWPYPSQFHMDPPDFDSVEATCWRFLPPPIRNTINKLSGLEKNIKLITSIFFFLLIVNVATLPAKEFFPNFWNNDIERILNISGSFASIIGLTLSFNLFRNNK